MDVIKATDLRIGNNIYKFGEIITVTAEIIGLVDKQLVGDGVFKPIEITKYSLEYFGFDRMIEGYYSPNYQMLITFNEEDISVFLVGTNIDINHFRLVNIKYIHDLQNLYYALFNEELIFIDVE